MNRILSAHFISPFGIDKSIPNEGSHTIMLFNDIRHLEQSVVLKYFTLNKISMNELNITKKWRMDIALTF